MSVPLSITEYSTIDLLPELDLEATVTLHPLEDALLYKTTEDDSKPPLSNANVAELIL